MADEPLMVTVRAVDLGDVVAMAEEAKGRSANENAALDRCRKALLEPIDG